MGGGFGGGFAEGLAVTLQRAQQLQQEQAYKKALIEQSKLNTKMLENKLALASHEQQMMSALAETAGISMPVMPQQPAVAPAQPAEKSGLLRRIFGGGQAPAPTSAAAPPQQITQAIAQGQMANTIPGENAPVDPSKQALAKDMLFKKYFDMPPWREKYATEKADEQQKIDKWLDVGTGLVPVNKDGKIMGAMMPKAPQYDSITQTGPGGETTQTFYNKFNPPGVQGGVGSPVLTKPPAQAMQEAMPDATKDKLNKAEMFLNKLQDLKKLGQNDKVFGIVPGLQGYIADTPLGAVIPIDKDIIEFRKTMKAIENAKIHEFGGTALSTQELQRELSALPNANNRQNFHTALDVIIKATKDDINQYKNFYSQSDIQRRVGQSKPSLNLGQPKVTKEKIETDYQNALRKRPDLKNQLDAERDRLLRGLQ